MSKLISKFLGFFRSRTLAGVDKAGNRYFTRKEEIDGLVKEKRWVVFRSEDDPTSLPVEWICWLNGQRKRAPTPQEMIELEAMRERVRLNIAHLKEEDERKSASGSLRKVKSTGKVGSPDLKSFIQQFPGQPFNQNKGKVGSPDLKSFIQQFPGQPFNQNKGKGTEEVSDGRDDIYDDDRSSEPTGTGGSFKPGAWQPPT